ncbi:BRO family protein [Pseudomonas cichorii]|uniref:BRO-N domain-containing protein n=1 Tax=Pseudomonas cichorii TaxID=36746 RepID=UPI000EFFF023|nr:BRO family protein [Pseudomonas cichorii]
MNSPILLDYHAEHGSSKIRSFYVDEKLYVSLEDVVLTLAKSNTSINNRIKTGLGALLKAQLEVLDIDEYEHFSVPDDTSTSPRKEVFITQPGLYRLISRDNTPASKKFQRWLFHEVLPSIHKHGTYPAPEKQDSSEIMSLAHALAQNTNLLIREIEEREKLALETKLRFENTERRLYEINQKIEEITPQLDHKNHTSISNYCDENKLGIDQQHLWAMCTKLCIEQGISVKKISKNGTKDHFYPLEIIKNSIKIINRE